MDVSALKVFLAVADTGSFSRAAEQVFLTQPAISKRIATLETELGQPLFDRLGRRIMLTEAGQTLLPRARSIVADLKDARRALANLTEGVHGLLSMATSHHVGLHRLPPILRYFNQHYPEVELDLHFMDSEEAARAVVQGRLELAVITLPRNPDPQLKVIPIWEDPMAIVAAPGHALGKERQANKQTLTRYPAILPGPGTVTRDLVLDALGPTAADIRIAMSTNYLEVLKMLAAIGLGWSALPRTMIDAELKVVHIEDMVIQRQLGIVVHGARTLSRASHAMLELIQDKA